jgi:hypothetical protein
MVALAVPLKKEFSYRGVLSRNFGQTCSFPLSVIEGIDPVNLPTGLYQFHLVWHARGDIPLLPGQILQYRQEIGEPDTMWPSFLTRVTSGTQPDEVAF